MPKNVAINPFFDWQGDHRPDVRLYETVIYEMHVKGFTKRHPEVPEELRGTYLGMVEPAAIEHLTALQLPPGRWTDVFTGEEASGEVLLAEVLRRFPVALLTREDAAMAAPVTDAGVAQ